MDCAMEYDEKFRRMHSTEFLLIYYDYVNNSLIILHKGIKMSISRNNHLFSCYIEKPLT